MPEKKHPFWIKKHEMKQGNKTLPGVLLLLYVQPGASKTAVKGVFESSPPRLKISIHAPPIEGAANESLIQFLAKALRLSASSLVLVSGETSRQKNIWVPGISVEAVLQAFSL